MSGELSSRALASMPKFLRERRKTVRNLRFAPGLGKALRRYPSPKGHWVRCTTRPRPSN